MKLRRIMGSMVMVLALVAGLVGVKGPDAEAKTRSMTTFVGEVDNITIFMGGAVKSVKSSKKSVVKVKKNGTYGITATSKKAGKAKVTVRCARGTMIYNFKVKKAKLTCKVKNITQTSGNLYTVAFEISNPSSVPMEKAQVNYGIYDASGTPIKENNFVLNHMIKGSKAYYAVTVFSQTPVNYAVAKCAGACGYCDYKGTNAKKKVSVKLNGTKSVTFKSKKTATIECVADLVGYDDNGNIIEVTTLSNYFYKKGKETRSVFLSDKVKKWKVCYRAVQKKKR